MSFTVLRSGGLLSKISPRVCHGFPRHAGLECRFFAAPLHPTPSERARMLEQASSFLERLERQPPPLAGTGVKWMIDPTQKDERKCNEQFVASLPLDIGEVRVAGGLEEILRDVLEPGARFSTNDNSPGYMAYIPSGGLFHAAVADLMGTALNRYVTIDQAAPVFAAIERKCIDWMCKEVVGWSSPGSMGGVLTSGGSMANLLGLHAARTSKVDSGDLPKATVYVSEQAHYCVKMAAKLIGVQSHHVRIIPSSSTNQAMELNSLKRMIDADLEKGLIPVAVCAMAGTTNSGAVDDIKAIANVCHEKRIWLHVDGAYGAFFALTAEGRDRLQGMELADSVVLDPHKSLFLPYGLGALLVKDQFVLQKGNRSDGACMQPAAEGTITDIEDIMNLSPELTRDFRGLRMWLPLKMLGVEAFRAQLEEKIALARHAALAIGDGSIPSLKVVHPPQLSIFTFKLDDGLKNGEELDALNIEFLNCINARGNVILSAFRSIDGFAGELCIRMAILSHHTDLASVTTAISDVRAAALEVQRIHLPDGATQATAPMQAAYLPDMLSNNSFYETAYVLRRRSSTMQSSMINFLSSKGKEVVWSTLHAPNAKRLKMLTIGCGDGELDFALLDSFSVTDAIHGIDLLAMEPNTDLREKFAENLPKQQWYDKDIKVSLEDAFFDVSSEYLSNSAELHDVILACHVLYYFPDKVEALRSMIRQVKPGGTMVVVHQSRQGVPEIQETVLPSLRGSLKDMFTADDIDRMLRTDLTDEVASFVNHEIPAHMNTADVLKGSEDGLKIMSFSVEADLRAATLDQVNFVRKEFEQKSIAGPVIGHTGDGPFMYEPVHCFVVQRN